MSPLRCVAGYIEFENVVLCLEDGSQKRFPAEYIAYVKRSEYVTNELLRKIIWREQKNGHITGYRFDGDYLRLKYINRYRREESCSSKGPYVEGNIPTFEADVSPLRRLIADSQDIELIPPSRRTYMDIETDSRKTFKEVKEGKARILCWTLVTKERVIKYGMLNEDTDEDERRLLKEYWEIVGTRDQIVAWNGHEFDFPVLKSRSKVLGIGNYIPKGILELDHMMLYKRWNTGAAESGEEKQSFALENVGQYLLGVGKHHLTPEEREELKAPPMKSMGALSWDMWAAGGKFRQKLLDYMNQDGLLMVGIEEKTGYIDAFEALCQICKVFPETRSLQPTSFFDGYMFQIGKEKGIHFPTKFYDGKQEEDEYKGAYVMQPDVSGIVHNVFVGDFQAMYPSLLVSFNMSWETKISGPTAQPFCTVPITGIRFSTSELGILPIALIKLLDLRAYWKKQAKEALTSEARDIASRLEKAYKIAINSCYGVVGSKYSRFLDKDIAESTTQAGAWLLRDKTLPEIKRLGGKPIYADTDSSLTTDIDESKFREILKHCNEVFYPALLNDLGCISNRMNFQFDKAFSRIVFTAAKRYVGIKSNGSPEIKGLELKRGDTIRMARELQIAAVRLFIDGDLNPDSYRRLLNDARARILETPMTLEDVLITKSIARDLKAYVQKTKKDGTLSTQPAHVRLAKLMQEDGQNVTDGTRIGYVVVNSESDPSEIIKAEDYNGNFDRYYYFDNLVAPPTTRLLTAMFPTEDFSEYRRSRPTKREIKMSKQLSWL